MKLKTLVILILSVVSFGLPKKIQKKVDKEIKKVYELESFQFEEFSIEQAIAKELPSKFDENHLFTIKVENNLLGYAYLSKAPSKTAEFDYLVLLNIDLSIKKAKVLIYREEYGGEIGSKRWLRQFVGKTYNDETFRYGDNIDAISGATISVRSMTNAMNDLMLSLKILNKEGIL